MKSINETFTDKEFKEIQKQKLKEKKSWHDFIMKRCSFEFVPMEEEDAI